MASSSYQPVPTSPDESNTDQHSQPHTHRAGTIVPVTVIAPPDAPLFNEHNPFYQHAFSPADAHPVAQLSHAAHAASVSTSSSANDRNSYNSTASEGKRLPKWANKIIHPIEDRREKRRVKEERSKLAQEHRGRELETFLEPWRREGASEARGVESEADGRGEVAQGGVDMTRQ